MTMFNPPHAGMLITDVIETKGISELLGVAYTQIRNPDSNLSLLGRS